MPLEKPYRNAAQKNYHWKCSSKKYPENLSLKTIVRKRCLNHYRSKHSSKTTVAEGSRKTYIESVAKSNSTQMLLKKPPLETFVKTIRSRKLSKNVLRISATNNNRAEVLLRKPPLETFVRTTRSRMPLKSVSRKNVAKTTVPKCWIAVQKAATQSARQN